jgi:EAL domain-containing protein (putative c-di-GMP-specific phosphodiesterase class I)/ActR/RegA family two-component response regulator
MPGVATRRVGEPAAPMAQGATDPRQRQPAIMIVDDDPHMLALQARTLQRAGFGVPRTAAHAREALDILAAGASVDVIICDIQMPGIDGVEFLRSVNASGMEVAVILLSGTGLRIVHAVQKLLSGGTLTVLGALEKPAGRTELELLLRNWSPPRPAPSATRAPEYSESDLRAAMREQQWVLHYQPKVELRSGAFVGVETLVRWQHPQHGLVYPDRFLSLAEDCGVIEPMTEWILAAAMRQQAAWHATGVPTRMAVNVSMNSLRDDRFAGRVIQIVREAGVSAQALTIEVTESRLMAASAAPLENLVRMRLQGIDLSIDDFGTGHSTLVQLRDVPFTELKVDRSFVTGARAQQIVRPILEGSLGIARRMGMLSVAEGVETEDDWWFLRELGCDLAQGYFIGRPMPADELPAWLNAWHGRRALLVKP